MHKICTVDSCDGTVNARGMCTMHYNRWAKTGSTERVCLTCGVAVKDGRTRWCSTDCKPRCAFESCVRPAYASNGLCASHDRQRLQKGVLTPFQPRTTQPGGSCVVCEAPIPANLKQKYCSDSCKVGASRRRRKGATTARPKEVACRGCGSAVSLTERRADGKLRRSDGKWCNTCLDQASRRRMYRYGVSPDRYATALITGCQICGQAETELHIDHDHDCCPGQYTCGNCVRGFLCGSCNRALGLLNNDPDRMLSAAAYVISTRDVLCCATTDKEG